jgi:crotonobetainyl-CoA:carnitine CoA-transferase CaiB-like acyl-CoA transferase
VQQTVPSKGALSGLLVLDLSRILAGPTCTQILGDLGAEVIKIERPGRGDDTRGWGPPFLKNADGERNRGKRLLSLFQPQQGFGGHRSGKRGRSGSDPDLAAKADILVENFKVGDLKRRGLDYETLKAINPKLIYCSISGFGQTGPYSHRAGYDFLIQGMGGIMSLTGFDDEDGGTQTKCGVGIADVMCGMYATVSDSRRASSPASNRRGAVHRHLAVGCSGVLAHQSGCCASGLWRNSRTAWERAPDHCAV